MKLIETIKQHPRTTAAVAALLFGAAAIEGVGLLKNPTYDRPDGACVSPMAVSNTYVDPGANLLLQTQTGVFTTGVIAHGTLPPGAYGVEASFKAPGADEAAWDTNASKMLKADITGNFALKMAIGPGEVEFGVRLVATAGSSLCDIQPRVTYEYKESGAYFDAPGELPWPNAANVVANVF